MQVIESIVRRRIKDWNASLKHISLTTELNYLCDAGGISLNICFLSA